MGIKKHIAALTRGIVEREEVLGRKNVARNCGKVQVGRPLVAAWRARGVWGEKAKSGSSNKGKGQQGGWQSS